MTIFFAEYFGYILIFLLLSFLFWPFKTKKAEGGRENWMFPRVGKQAFAEGGNARNREVSGERSEANEVSASRRLEERSDFFLFKNFRKYWKMVILSFSVAILARFVIVDIIRWFFDRPRPFVENHVNLLVDKVNQSAFPSGHAAFFFAISTIVYLYNKKAGLLFFIASFLISIARVFSGIHWPLDILTGAIIGILSSFLVILSFRKFFSVVKK